MGAHRCRRIAVGAAVVVLTGVSAAVMVGGAAPTARPHDEVAQPDRAVAPVESALDVDAAPLRIAERREPRPADAPLWATLAVLASLAILVEDGLLVGRRQTLATADASVPGGSRGPPTLLAA